MQAIAIGLLLVLGLSMALGACELGSGGGKDTEEVEGEEKDT